MIPSLSESESIAVEEGRGTGLRRGACLRDIERKEREGREQKGKQNKRHDIVHTTTAKTREGGKRGNIYIR